MNYSYFNLFFCLLKHFKEHKKSSLIVSGVSLLIARLSQFVAFFLPLKIFLLIGSDTAPDYISQLHGHLAIEDLIFFLVCLVPLFYMLFFVFGVISRRFLDAHYSYLDEHDFLKVSKGLKQLSRPSHGRVIKMLSDGMLIVISVLFSALMSKLMFVFLLLLLLLSIFIFAQSVVGAQDSHRLTPLKLHRRQFVEYIVSADFIVIFILLGFMLYGGYLGVYESIFLLLLSRMTFQALQRFTIENILLQSGMQTKANRSKG